MKYEITRQFRADYKTLSDRERLMFKRVVLLINKIYDEHVRSGGGGLPRWPKELRLKRVTDAPGVNDVTWSFAGLDGRATFDFFATGRQVGIRWRRTGDHRIIKVRKA